MTLSPEEIRERAKIKFEEDMRKADEQESKMSAPDIDFKELCLKKYGFWHEDFNFNVSGKKVSIKVNMLSLQRIINMLQYVKDKGGLRFSTGDNLAYLGSERLSTSHIFDIQQHLIHALKGENIVQQQVERACSAAARENKFDRLREYFENLQQSSGKNYIENWLQTCFGVEDTEINRIIGKKWLVSAVARALEPGCYAEGVLVLSGGQAKGKTSACKALSPFPDAYFGDFVDITNTQKSAQTLQGKFLVEFAELSSMNSRTIEDIKNWITRTSDTYIEKYSNLSSIVERQFICLGTTNAPTPLNDPSGNRRWWAVYVGDINIERIVSIRDELWAEALEIYMDWSKDPLRVSCKRDPWVLTEKEREMLATSNKDFETPCSVTDWLRQNIHDYFTTDSFGWIKFSDIKKAVSKLERIGDLKLSNILTLELGCTSKRRSDGVYYKHPTWKVSAENADAKANDYNPFGGN